MKIKSAERAALYIGGGLLLFGFYSKARALGNLIFSPGQVIGMGFQDSNPLLQFSVRVQNTSSSSLTINSFAGTLYSNGTLIGNIYNFVPVSIMGNSQTQFIAQVQLQAIGLINDILNAFTTHNATQNIRVEGSANVMGVQLPVAFNLTVGV